MFLGVEEHGEVVRTDTMYSPSIHKLVDLIDRRILPAPLFVPDIHCILFVV